MKSIHPVHRVSWARKIPEYQIESGLYEGPNRRFTGPVFVRSKLERYSLF